jgi:hypothetical protein
MIDLPPNELDVPFGYFSTAQNNVSLFVLYFQAAYFSGKALLKNLLYEFTKGGTKTQV